LRGWRDLLHGDGTSDHSLELRIRTTLADVTPRSSSLVVRARNGRIVLSGPIVPHDERRVVSAVLAVPGVKAVETRFDDFEQNVPPTST
jgi:osmotically-inducible protein OsmY